MNLQLPLTTFWFELTKSGIKPEDYREITPYWIKRITGISMTTEDFLHWFNNMPKYVTLYHVVKKFTTNTMTLGYPKSTDSKRIIKFEHAGIEVRTGNPEWGAEPNKLYFVIKHGKQLNT